MVSLQAPADPADKASAGFVRHPGAVGRLLRKRGPVAEVDDLARDVAIRVDARRDGRGQSMPLLAAIEELPARSRQAFILHRFEEMPYAAIARHMGIPASAVEKHIMKAIRHLAATIA